MADLRAAFAYKEAGIDWNPSQSSQEDEIYAPGSMPIEWNRRNVPCLLEWRKRRDSQKPRKSDRSVQRAFFTESAPKIPAARPRATGEHHHLGRSGDGTRSSKAWTIALCALRGCRDTHELRVSLELMETIISNLIPSELRLARVDFEVVIKQKRETSIQIFTPAVETLVTTVVSRFKQETTACLPLHVMQVVLEFVDLSENGELCAVSKDFRETAEGDGLWRGVYEKRFSKDPQNRKSSPDMRGFKHRYNTRLQDPFVGDRVEVAWKGKFRLESLEVYDGTAWWIGQVVDKSKCPGNYKIHYPGWEAKWDEWVPRERLRWGNERLAKNLEGATPAKGDSVEMWCQGLHVPGAWLEAVVHEVEKDRLLPLGAILTTGHFWVNPKSVRLVKKGRQPHAEKSGVVGFGDISPCRRRSILMQALDEAGFTSGS
ncbi:unnamed protein product, partial [Scytosiphon promiscuus]